MHAARTSRQAAIPTTKRKEPSRLAASHVPLTHDLLFLQRTIGNRATSLAIQREFEDQGEKAAPQPVLEEAASGAVNVEGVNAFGESDGMVGSGVAPHAMSNKGKTGSDLWAHAGGAGGVIRLGDWRA